MKPWEVVVTPLSGGYQIQILAANEAGERVGDTVADVLNEALQKLAKRKRFWRQ